MPALKSENTPSEIRTVCIIGVRACSLPPEPTSLALTKFQHDAISTELTNALSKTCRHVHLVYYSSYALSHVPRPNITLHQHPSKTFTDLDLLKPVLSNLSPPAHLLINTSHGGDYALQSLLMTACVETDIPRFMPAEFSLDSLNPHVQRLLPPHAERAKTIDLLQENAAAGRLQWIGLATGCDISSRLIDGRMGVDLTWQSATVFGTGTEQFATSSPDFTVRAVMAAMDHWDAFCNRYLCVCGLETSYSQILDALERQLGRDFEVSHHDVDEGIHEAQKRIAGGWPDAGIFLLERSALADERCFDGFQRDRASRAKLGLEAEPLDTLIRKVVHDFKHHGKGDCGCS